jgi:phage FluMu protein Com
MVLITCKKCGELDYYTSQAFCNLTDFGYKCPGCNTINRITLENGELKKQV